MRFGLLLADLNDSIREGDGKRLVNLYKIAVLLYKYHGHTKYAYTTLLFLTKVKSVLPAERAESLIANRFCNNHGKPGKNISMDLFLEHENKSVKSYTDLLGSNFKEESAQRIARATGIRFCLVLMWTARSPKKSPIDHKLIQQKLFSKSRLTC